MGRYRGNERRRLGGDPPRASEYLQQLGYGMLDIGICAPADGDDAASARALARALALELAERGLSQHDLSQLRARGFQLEPRAHGLHLVVQRPPAA